MSDPLGYHITWTTYGTWLSGDARGWIKSGEPGIQEPDAAMQDEMRTRMPQEPVYLDESMRAIADQPFAESSLIADGRCTP